jgi:hypothetical protein
MVSRVWTRLGVRRTLFETVILSPSRDALTSATAEGFVYIGVVNREWQVSKSLCGIIAPWVCAPFELAVR